MVERKTFTEDEKAEILKALETSSTKDVIEKYKVSSNTLSNWKKKVSKTMPNENEALRQKILDMALENAETRNKIVDLILSGQL